nr:MAG TPA: hypothetical protein [Caudoviricetes sp.]
MVLAPRVCDIHRHGRLGRIAGPLGTGRRCPSRLRRRRTRGTLGSLARFRRSILLPVLISGLVPPVEPLCVSFGSLRFQLAL